MRSQFISIVLVSLSAANGLTTRGDAGEYCCAICGHAQPCQKVCRLVCEEKKVEVVCWGEKCEFFCVPGPSEPGCKHCDMVCQDCDKSCDSTVPHSTPKKFVWRDWIPGCAKVYAKTKLMKKIETKTIKTHKWVVEDLCQRCEANCPCATISPGDDVPAPPVADARLKYNVAELAMLPAVGPSPK